MKQIWRWLFLVLFISLFWFGFSNSQSIRDWWVLRSFSPSNEIVSLADDTGMSDQGRQKFYVSQPELNSRASFNDNCPFPDRSLVLGCYASLRIYIFDVDDPQLEGVEEVTAAHEMLHAVYDRLSTGDRDRRIWESRVGSTRVQWLALRSREPESFRSGSP